MRNHVLQPGKLLDQNGHLAEAGYATSMVKEYNRNQIKANGLRIKEWDYYLIYNEDYGVALTYADNSYMGLIGASILDFKKNIQITTNVMTVLPLGKTMMPSTTEVGDVLYENKRVKVAFLNDGRKRRIAFRMKQFDGEKELRAEFVITRQPQSDQMVIATPYDEKKTAFYYNSKIVGMDVTGHVTVGTKIYSFHENSQAILDWGRGVWTYKNTWYWSCACGNVNGHRVGFNLGYGFGNTSKASENCIFYDGKLHKLDDVIFEIPKDKNGNCDFMKPWRFVSSDHRFEAVFKPIFDRSSLANVGIICSNQHQVFGRFTGEMKLDDGSCIKLNDFLGFAEKVINKW